MILRRRERVRRVAGFALRDWPGNDVAIVLREGKNPVGDNAPGENPATPGSAWGNTKGLAMALRKEKKEDTQ